MSPGFTAILLSVVFSKPLPVFTLYLILDTVLSVVSTTAVVPSPLTKFTVSYAFTKSFAASLFCKFQPAFNTSPTVAALCTLTWPAAVPNVGAVALVVGAVLFGLAPSKLPATFDNTDGVCVPLGPFTDVITSFPSTVSSFGPFPSGVVWYVVPFGPSTGYTFVPSALVYTTGEAAVVLPPCTSTVIVRMPFSVLPDTTAIPVPTNLTSFAFFTVSEYAVSVAVPSAPVVLSADTIQPILRKSPTVATVSSDTASFTRLRNVFLAGTLPLTLGASKLTKLLVILFNAVGLVVPVLPALGLELTKAVFNGVVAESIGSITLLSSSTN